jgi:hypothetical protein
MKKYYFCICLLSALLSWRCSLIVGSHPSGDGEADIRPEESVDQEILHEDTRHDMEADDGVAGEDWEEDVVIEPRPDEGEMPGEEIGKENREETVEETVEAIDRDTETVEEVDDTGDDPGEEDIPVEIGPGTCTADDLVDQSLCAAGHKCTLGEISSCVPATICDDDGTQYENQACSATGESDNCQSGYFCMGDVVENRCRKFCHDDSDCHIFGANSGCQVPCQKPSTLAHSRGGS